MKSWSIAYIPDNIFDVFYINKESYDTKNLRNFITARFTYTKSSVKKNVLIVELDQKSSNGFSVFIFIANNADIYNDYAKIFLRKYAINVNFDKIKNDFSKQGIRLIRKNHPEKGDKNKRFEAWCWDLNKKFR